MVVHPRETVQPFLASVLETSEVWVATADGDLVGFAAVGPDGDLDHLYVARPHTGTGWARLLAAARQRHPEGLSLWVFASNTGAVRFYDGTASWWWAAPTATTRNAPPTCGWSGDREPRRARLGGCRSPSRHLLRAKDLADARYAEPLTVADLAAAARLSPAHFSREFRRAFGESPHQYLLTRRLERAAALLRTTDRSVAADLRLGGPEQRRLVHDELRADVRDAAHGLPRRPPAGRRRSRGCRPAWCAPTAARRYRTFREDAACRSRWTGASPQPRRHDQPRDEEHQHDQHRHRPAVGARPGRGARVLHREGRLGGAQRRHRARDGQLPLADRRARPASPTSPSC